MNGARDAINAYTSKAKPVSKHYEELRGTIEKVICEGLEVDQADEKAVKEVLRFTKFDYAEGDFHIMFNYDKEKDTPMPVLPSKVIRALRDVDDVMDVDYLGFSIDDKETDEDAAGQPKTDEDGNPIAQNNDDKNETQDIVSMDLHVYVKGDPVDLSVYESENAEEAQ